MVVLIGHVQIYEDVLFITKYRRGDMSDIYRYHAHIQGETMFMDFFNAVVWGDEVVVYGEFEQTATLRDGPTSRTLAMKLSKKEMYTVYCYLENLEKNFRAAEQKYSLAKKNINRGIL